jgi:hypothetical protein
VNPFGIQVQPVTLVAALDMGHQPLLEEVYDIDRQGRGGTGGVFLLHIEHLTRQRVMLFLMRSRARIGCLGEILLLTGKMELGVLYQPVEDAAEFLLAVSAVLNAIESLSRQRR